MKTLVGMFETTSDVSVVARREVLKESGIDITTALRWELLPGRRRVASHAY
jgi:hypothetical protein